MPKLDPHELELLIAAAVLLLVAAAARRTQQPGQRLGFFLRTAKDAAIVLTVIALLFQLRASTRATRLDAYSRSLDFYSRLHQAQLGNPNLQTMLYGPGDPFTRLSPGDQERYQYLIQVVEFYQRLWLGHREGVLDDAVWAGWEQWLEDGIVTIPLFRTVWAEERRYYHEAFVAYLDEKLAGANAATPPP